ncbi:MAG: hypothetical protein QW097_00135 [archaeon]
MLIDLSKKKLFTENLYAFISQILRFLSSFIFIILFPILLSPNNFGKLSLFLGIAYFLSGLLISFFSYVVIVRFSKFCAENNIPGVRADFVKSLKIFAVFYLLLTFFLLLFKKEILFYYNLLEFESSYHLLLMLIFLGVVDSIFYGLFLSTQRLKVWTENTILFSVSYIFLPVLFFLLFGLNGIVFGIFLSNVFVFIHIAYNSIGILKGKRKEMPYYWEDFKTLCLVAVFNVVAWQGILPLLGLFNSSEYLAFFRISLGWTSSLAALFPISSSFLISSFTAVAVKKPQKIEEYLRKTTRYFFLFSIPMMVGAFVISAKMIKFIYGPNYLPAADIFKILVFCLPALLLANLFQPILFNFKKYNVLRNVGLYLTLLFIISILLSPASLIPILFVVFNWLFAILLFLNMPFKKIFSFKPLIKIVVSAALMGILVSYLLNFATSLISALSIIAFGAFSYFAILYLLKGVEKTDLDFLNIFLNKFGLAK